ncbi:hypothetical protein [Pseudomonas brenneri]|nr:hypothetical protein [Pseudomonas brenneri]
MSLSIDGFKKASKSKMRIFLGYSVVNYVGAKRLTFCTFACISIIASLFASQASAEKLPENTEPNPLSLGSTSTGQVESVDPWSGNLTVRHKDLELPGNGGLDIQVWRTYDMNSASAQLLSSHNQSYRWTALGPGWTLSAAPKISIHSRFQLITHRNSPPTVYYAPHALIRVCAGEGVMPAGVETTMLNIELPGGGNERLYRTGNYRALTKSGWKLDCLNNNVALSDPKGVVYDYGPISDIKVGRVFISDAERSVDVGDYLSPLPSRTDTYMLAKSARSPNGNLLNFHYQGLGDAIPLWTMPGTNKNPRFIVGGSPASIESPSQQLTAITSNDGRQVKFSYAPDTGRLISMSADDRVWKYFHLTPDAMNSRNLSKVILPDGNFWSYSYAPGAYTTVREVEDTIPLNSESLAIRKLISVTYPAGGTSNYEYTFSNFNTTVRTIWNQRKFYVGGERISKRKLSSGEEWKYTYTRGSSGIHDITQVSGPEGVTSYKFFGPSFSLTNNIWRVGKVAEKKYSNGSIETYSWDPRVFIDISTDLIELGIFNDEKTWVADLTKTTIVRDGATYTTTYAGYDAYGNPGSRTETGPNGGNRTTTFTYFNDPNKWIIGRPKNETSPGRIITRTYDANGNVLTQVLNGVTTSYTYDAQGNLASKTLPRGDLYTYSNYKLGVAQSETQPEGIKITRLVDNAGNVISDTNGEGFTTRYTYDGLRRATSIIPALGNTTTINYTPTSKTRTRGPLIETALLDPFGREASVTVGGVTTKHEYDGYGRITFDSNPGVLIGTRYEYDPLGRKVRQTNADGTVQTISYGPGTRSVTDERGKVTTYTYRAYGDPDKPLLMAITAPEASANVTLERSPGDLITAVTQAGLKRTYGYDSRNYLISVTNPETGVTTYGRDIAGNMTTRQVGTSGITRYAYDGLNRLTSTTYPGATPAITNTYNKNSKLLTSNASGGNRSFAYDAASNLIQESLALDGRLFTTKYAYNGNDQLSSVTYPQSARVVNYTPDALGRPTTVSGYITNIKYWPSSLLQSITYANGTVSTYGQNNRLWPTSFSTQKVTPASLHLNNTYTYDGIGNLITINDTLDGNFNRTLGYDNINRLTSAAGFWGQGSIAYDGGGNLLKQTLGQSSLTYTYDTKNRLSTVSGLRASSYGYDVYGNISSSQGNAYTYNDVPNLTCINCSNPAAKIEYSYDGLNHRSAVIKASGKVYEMHDSGGKPLIEVNGNTLTEYFYIGDKRIAQRVSP